MDDPNVFDLTPAIMSANALCEGCGAPATTCDSMDTPLCEACYLALDPVDGSEVDG